MVTGGYSILLSWVSYIVPHQLTPKPVKIKRVTVCDVLESSGGEGGDDRNLFGVDGAEVHCSGVRGRTKVESGLFFLLYMNAAYGSLVRILGAAEFGVGSEFFKCSEWGKVRYLVMLELMPPQALNLVEIAVTESVSRVIRVPIT